MVHGGEKKETFYSISSFRRSNDSSDSEMTDESFFSDSESGRFYDRVAVRVLHAPSYVIKVSHSFG